MGKGKQSSEGQAIRRQQIIAYIRKNGPVKGSKICENLDMSRSSLSDDIRAINTKGEVIASPKRGVYVIGSLPQENGTLYSRIDGPSVRRWMILLSLIGRDKNFEGIMEYLKESEVIYSQAAVYEDLKVLMQAGMITRKKDGKKRIYHSECLYETDLREIAQYTDKKTKKSTRVAISIYKNIDLKIKRSIPGYESDTEDSGTLRSGKHNILTVDQMRMMQKFAAYPYRERELLVTFMTNAGREVSRDICVGIIVYVVETARIYLIGENEWKNTSSKEQGGKNYVVIPMDSIISVSGKEKINTRYNAPEYHRIFREMFQISAEEAMNVRVRFENYPFIKDKLQRLCAVRETAHMQEHGKEILFTDTIRGRGDFARYLRRFGRSAIVEEPAQLREDMINSSRKILALYE